jgi:outer membrane protein OmpA-like peptidoglycan-associated protein
MKHLYSLLLLLVINESFIAQQSLIHLFEKKKYDRLEERIIKDFEKIEKGKMDVLDPRLYYARALLFNEKEYNLFQTDSAYKNLVISKNILVKCSDEKLKSDLTENLFDVNLINLLMKTICENVLIDLRTKNSEDSFNSYLNYYKEGDADVSKIVIALRNKLSFDKAREINTIEGYQDFLVKYPNAGEISEAILFRNQLAFNESEKNNSVADYKMFIQKYPQAIQIPTAWEKIYLLEFEDCKSRNYSTAYYNYLKDYPKSPYFNEVKNLSFESEYQETVVAGDIESYKNFVLKFGRENPKKKIALDSLYNYYNSIRNYSGIEFCINNANGNQRDNFLLGYYEIYTQDGELTTFNTFFNKYNELVLKPIKSRDYEIFNEGKMIVLGSEYSDYNFQTYDSYIKKAAPKDRAFVALQRMIKKDIIEKNYVSAGKKVEQYKDYFKSDKNYNKLYDLIISKLDPSIRIIELTQINNSENGGQYCPILSADEKLLFFCARNREDNIGGEDIFYSKRISENNWSKPTLFEEINTAGGNEAIEQISSDNTSLYIFSGGKIKQTEIIKDGIGELFELSSNINQGSWQADLSLSSDGNALLFSSIYSDNYNYNIKSGNQMTGDLSDYHGSKGHQSDIYISLKDENGYWGKAINLGPVINTIHCDRGAFLHPDMKTLYFSSDGHGGLGDLDVFVSKRLADSCWNCWSEPINMGKEINSTSSDWGYQINTNGDKAFFSKDSKISYLNLPKHLRPNYVATVNGVVTNDKGEMIECSIKWEDLETGKIIGTSKSNPQDGSYYMVLPLGKNYGYFIEKEGYFPLSNNVDVKKADKAISINEDIILISYKQMIEEGKPVRLNNLFFNPMKSDLLPSSIPELNRVAIIIKKDNLKVEISGHTDNVGEDEMNQKLSEDRALSVKNYLIEKGVNPENLENIGLGKSKPVQTNATSEGRAKNRRVELRIIK